ncbi:efflux RND transporter periplasmic adaptor subunit [Yunchengibacter salinarum]|uniref:efflux RND transporter periplasmic adaptor subunit n=1 Tax=Yunchengibacter salinarum TaxID=3133399 RepID=UPI0035B571D1
MSRAFVAIWVVALWVGLAAPASGQSGDGAPVAVMTRPVSLSSDGVTFRAVGTGRARLSVDLFPQAAGEVTAVSFAPGEKVAKGDVLLQLDDRDQALALELAKVRLADARSLLNRFEEAVKEGAVPESEVDSARADFTAARVAVDQARLALEDRTLIAPFDGYVGLTDVDAGDRVTTSTLITGLDARDSLLVDFVVPESLAGPVLSGAARDVRLTTPALPGTELTGRISARESRIDPMRRTLAVRAKVDNSRDLLRPGMSFDVRLPVPGELRPTVPEIALQWGRDGAFVWLVSEGRVKKVGARVVARRAGRVLLDGDIPEGAPVVVEGLQRLRDGRAVRPVGDDGPTSAAGGGGA